MAEPNPNAGAAEAGVNVLIVDDDDAVRDSLSVLIETTGRSAREFASAEAFIDWLETGGNINGACLILDNNMPGITGIELLESLRRKGRRTPVIMITGGQAPGLAERIARADRAVCLDKPIDPAELLGALDRALGHT